MIRSQFSYYPLMWMFSSRKSNNLINKVHERSLKIVSGDTHSSFKSLLSNCKEITIHQRNLQVPMTETYNIINGIFPIMEKKFILRENTHNVRNVQEISNENRKTVKYGIETISNWHCDKCMCVGYAKIFSKIYGFDKTSGLVNFSETIKKKLKCSFKKYT